MTDPARGPTTEELRARVLAQLAEAAMHEPRHVLDALTADRTDTPHREAPRPFDGTSEPPAGSPWPGRGRGETHGAADGRVEA